MSIASSGLSALGRLLALAGLIGIFLFGMVGVVYMSLQGAEITVPEITGKNIRESEKDLAMLGLKIKKRAERASSETPDTVIEQLPKPGETVKTGQLILVVTSKGQADGDLPPSMKNISDEDDTEKIEEMISDKPKKPKSNSNARKKADTARDVNTASSDVKADSGSDSKTSDSESSKKEAEPNKNSSDKTTKDKEPPAQSRPNTSKTPAADPKPRPKSTPNE